jgi:hypothetical protein
MTTDKTGSCPEDLPGITRRDFVGGTMVGPARRCSAWPFRQLDTGKLAKAPPAP